MSCYLALVLERIGYLKVEREGLDLSNHEVIEQLKEAKLLAVEQPSTLKTLFLRTPLGGDKETNRKARERVDTLLSLVNIPKIEAYETFASLTKKLSEGSRFKIRN